MKRLEKARAIELRKSGETIPNIARQLHVSKASVSLWMKGQKMPAWVHERMKERADANRRKANEVRRHATKNEIAQSARDAENLVRSGGANTVTALICCSLMYWCEGTKSKNDSECTFTNADPLTIRGYIRMFRRAFLVDENKFRIKMHLHEYHAEPTQRQFWSRITSIPESQFTKAYWKPHTGKSIKPGYQGCIQLRYHDVRVARKIYATARAVLGSVV